MRKLSFVLFAALSFATYGCATEDEDTTTGGAGGAGGAGGLGGSGGVGGLAGSGGTGGASGCVPETDVGAFTTPQSVLTETPVVCFGNSFFSLFPVSPCPTGLDYLEWEDDGGVLSLIARQWERPDDSVVPVQILSTSHGMLEGTSRVGDLPRETDITISTCELSAMTFRIDPNSLTITAATPN